MCALNACLKFSMLYLPSDKIHLLSHLSKNVVFKAQFKNFLIHEKVTFHF